jgi:hypothetical protein
MAMERIIKWKVIFIILPLLLSPLIGLSANWEYYSEPKVKIPILNGLYLNIKEEIRFKEGANYYYKTFSGLSLELNRHMDFSLYIAMIRAQKAQNWSSSHMVWPEISYKHAIIGSELSTNTKLEYFIISKTWTFRNQVSIAFPINTKLSFWVGDEPRLVSLFEKAYLGENEILTGVVCDFKIWKISSSLNVFYDFRSIKQNRNWQNTNCIRLAVNLTCL